jgi:hypothetical protein
MRRAGLRENIIYVHQHVDHLLTLLGLQQLCALVQHLGEELVPGQGAEDAEGCLTVRRISAEPKCPLSF